MKSLEEMIELGDVDELLREIDRRSGHKDWSGILDLRNRCRWATERGKTLWGVAGHAEYRLVLEASGDIAASVLDSDPGPLALGPLPEVAASTHEWRDLSPTLDHGPLYGLTAYECVAQGEDLGDEDLGEHERAFGLPFKLQSWEPRYATAEYTATKASFPSPTLTALRQLPNDNVSAETLVEPDATNALRDVTKTWTAESNGTAKSVAVQGSALDAIAVLGYTGVAVELSLQDALASLAWAGASGGAHGRRAGAASGRAKAWWAAAAMAGLIDDGALPRADELGEVLQSFMWWTWGALDHSDGWALRLAAHDTEDNIAFAIDARDQKN